MKQASGSVAGGGSGCSGPRGAARGSRGSLMLAATAGAIAGMAALVLPGLAQPGGGDPGEDRPRAEQRGQPGVQDVRSDGRPSREQPMSASALRERLERRLEDVRLIEQRIEEGLRSLDNQVPPEQVVRELFAPGLPRWEGWRGGGGRGGALDEDEQRRVLALIEQRMPAVAAWIEEERARDPRLLALVAARLAPQVREIERLHERDPEGARVRTEELVATIGVMRATRLYRLAVAESDADGEAATAARTALRAALVAQFDARLAARQHEAESLRRRIEALRQDIEAETSGREARIDAALERIMQAATGRGEQDPG